MDSGFGFPFGYEATRKLKKKPARIGKMRSKPQRQNLFFLIFLVTVLLTLVRLYFNTSHESNSASDREGGIRCVLKRLLSLFTRMDIFKASSAVAHESRGSNSVVIIYWTKVFGNHVSVGNSQKWPYFYIGSQCSAQCTLTTDHSRINEASAIVVHARNIEEMPPQDKIERRELRWILHSNESPRFTPALSSSQIMSKFNFYLSYRLDSDFPLSLFRQPQLEPRPVPFANKSKTPAVALYSHCEAVRTSYLVQLMRYLRVASFGKCLHNTDLPEHMKVGHSTTSKVSPIELYKNYKFTLVFMNSDCDYFVDEKLYHALSAGSVPVFLGTDKIREFLPGNLARAVIEVRDFATPKLLADYLNLLADNEEAYNRYLRWKYEGFKFPRNYSTSPVGHLWNRSLPVFCRVCMALQSGHMGKSGLQVECCARRSLKTWIKP